ncbi:MAG: hypothetical protein JWL81_3168, partial [Verrucomicrobiales bacterium]|nr:hypothetical protein [Verrucomicrobiales bacterium]
MLNSLKLTLLVLGAASARGELLYYEGFNYPVAEDGLKYQGGFAANPDPASGVDADIAPGSLRYMDASGNVLPASGNHALVDAHEERATVSNIAPVFRPPAPQPAGNVIWISLLGQQVAGSTVRFFNFSLRAPDDTLQPPDGDTNMDEIVAIGMPSGAAAQRWHVWDRSTGGNLWTPAITQTPSTTLSLALARVELNAVNGDLERYTLWMNPPLGKAPDEAEGIAMVSQQSDFAAWSDLEQIRLAAGQNPAASTGWTVDEIRIADSWQEALPWQSLTATVETAPQPAGALQVRWISAPGFTDEVEWSTDLEHWFSYPNSVRTNGPGNAPA